MSTSHHSETIDPKLAAALIKAQAEVKAALKTAENKFHNYKYASSEEVIIVGREALGNAELGMFPMSEDFEPLAQIDDRCGGAVAVVKCKYLVMHTSGATYTFSTDVPVVPERGKSSGWSRPADKATFGARTEAVSYALRDLLLIPREDAPNVSGRQDGPKTGPGNESDRKPPAPKASPDEHLARMVAATDRNDLGQCLSLARRDVVGELLAPIEAEFARKVCPLIEAAPNAKVIDGWQSYLSRLAIKGQPGEDLTKAIDAARVRLGAAPS